MEISPGLLNFVPKVTKQLLLSAKERENIKYYGKEVLFHLYRIEVSEILQVTPRKH